MPRGGRRNTADAAQISLVASTVNRRITVQNFAPFTGARQPDAIFFPQHRRQIQNDGQLVGAVGRLAHEGKNAVIAVVQSIQ
jgi:hypothetical protein